MKAFTKFLRGEYFEVETYTDAEKLADVESRKEYLDTSKRVGDAYTSLVNSLVGMSDSGLDEMMLSGLVKTSLLGKLKEYVRITERYTDNQRERFLSKE